MKSSKLSRSRSWYARDSYDSYFLERSNGIDRGNRRYRHRENDRFYENASPPAYDRDYDAGNWHQKQPQQQRKHEILAIVDSAKRNRSMTPPPTVQDSLEPPVEEKHAWNVNSKQKGDAINHESLVHVECTSSFDPECLLDEADAVYRDHDHAQPSISDQFNALIGQIRQTHRHSMESLPIERLNVIAYPFDEQQFVDDQNRIVGTMDILNNCQHTGGHVTEITYKMVPIVTKIKTTTLDADQIVQEKCFVARKGIYPLQDEL